jgi:hypothetical protein
MLNSAKPFNLFSLVVLRRQVFKATNVENERSSLIHLLTGKVAIICSTVKLTVKSCFQSHGLRTDCDPNLPDRITCPAVIDRQCNPRTVKSAAKDHFLGLQSVNAAHRNVDHTSFASFRVACLTGLSLNPDVIGGQWQLGYTSPNASPYRSIWLWVNGLYTVAVFLASSHTFESEQQATAAVVDGTDILDDLTLASRYKADESLARSLHWNCIGRWQLRNLEKPILICMV